MVWPADMQAKKRQLPESIFLKIYIGKLDYKNLIYRIHSERRGKEVGREGRQSTRRSVGMEVASPLPLQTNRRSQGT